MEATSASSGDRKRKPFLLNLPPGFHFAPTDEELIVHYLRRRIADLPPLLPIFIDANVVGCRPEEITDHYKDRGEDRWFFFAKRFRKYKRGSRPNRTTPDKGFWKATGPQRMIYTGKKDNKKLVGRVRTLVFYNAPKETDEPPKGTGTKVDKKAALSEGKTSWTMYEYENLTSEAEAADQNVDKIDEWVLCTIQTQKKEENKEGSGAAENKVEETNGKGEITEGSRGGEKKVKGTTGKIKAGNKKRKGKQAKTEAENGTDEDPIQALHLMKRSKVPVQATHPETLAREEADDMGMFDFPGKNSPMPTVQQDESPHSETMSPCITDNNYYGPNMAPTPCLHEPPHSEMTSTSVGGNYYNTGSAGLDFMSPMQWQGSPFSEIMPHACLAENTYSSTPSIVPTLLPQEAPHMKIENKTPSSFPVYNIYDNIDPRMMAHQPTTSYPYPLSAIGYGGAVQNTASHWWYPGVDFGSMFHSNVSGFHGGPSFPGLDRAVRPAAAALDQVTART